MERRSSRLRGRGDGGRLCVCVGRLHPCAATILSVVGAPRTVFPIAPPRGLGHRRVIGRREAGRRSAKRRRGRQVLYKLCRPRAATLLARHQSGPAQRSLCGNCRHRQERRRARTLEEEARRRARVGRPQSSARARRSVQFWTTRRIPRYSFGSSATIQSSFARSLTKSATSCARTTPSSTPT